MPAPRGELLHHFIDSRGQKEQTPPVETTKIISAARVDILKDHIHKRYEDGDGPRKAWQKLPEIPTSAEIMPPTADLSAFESDDEEGKDAFLKETLPSNIIDAPWNTKEEYIAAHYQLLREDGIAPLRNAVEIFKAQPTMMDSGDVCVYTQVYIVGYTMSTQGPAPRIEFSHERSGKRIRWSQSKRLQQGTIVAISPRTDMFKSICKIAVVAARPIEGVLQNPPQIDLFWGNENDAQIDTIEEYVMLESRAGYFEAYRHMLVAMQKLATESFPLSGHLAKLNKDIGPPEYLKKQPFNNLNALVSRSPSNALEESTQKSIPLLEELSNVNILETWPPISNTTLDESQMMALRRILSKNLAIVQGPPGTGKTFVSLSALKIMLDNWSPGDPPIIVSAQTNHAIDQLLMILATKIDPDLLTAFVRLGGRTNEDSNLVLDRTLHEVKMRDREQNFGRIVGATKDFSYRNSKRACDDAAASLKAVIETAINQSDNEVQMFFKEGIISKEQYNSLQDDDWVCAHDPNLPQGIMATWLGPEQIVIPPKCEPTNLGFADEEIDPDFESLGEMEAEHKQKDDDDSDALRGDWVPFKENFTGRHSPAYPEKRLRKILKNTNNLLDIDSSIRGEVYRYLRRKLKNTILVSFHQHFKTYMRSTKNLKLARWNEESILIHRLGIKLIGCTTTGLSKYRGLLASLQPRTLLIEEAAETLEGTVLAAQFETLQQLILVGDHQQLQANCNVSVLSKAPFNLATSMFERLVNNGIEFTMLNRQRRMISEIRGLLNDFYPNLQDHESVLDRRINRRPVPGMGGRDSYWFHHVWPERKDDATSRYNSDEAEMVVNFFAYLTLNGVDPSQITVLTFYNGQRKVLVKELRANPHLRSFVGSFNVFTVDSYQGEENDIILLSFVRSNNFAEIGFVQNKNRAVVALSRARRGLYVFGNLSFFLNNRSDKDDVWRSVTSKLAASSSPRLNMKLGLPIVCSNHGNETIINEPQEFDLVKGGCTLKCNGELPCGHACPITCHPFTHDQMNCREPCKKKMPDCEHGCSEICANKCRCPCDIKALELAAAEAGAKVRPKLLDDIIGHSPPKSFPKKNSHAHQRGESKFSIAEDYSRNVWSDWDPKTHDKEVAAQSRTASSTGQSTGGPIYRDKYIPVHSNKGRRKVVKMAATTLVVPSHSSSLRNNLNNTTDLNTPSPLIKLNTLQSSPKKDHTANEGVNNYLRTQRGFLRGAAYGSVLNERERTHNLAHVPLARSDTELIPGFLPASTQHSVSSTAICDAEVTIPNVSELRYCGGEEDDDLISFD